MDLIVDLQAYHKLKICCLSRKGEYPIEHWQSHWPLAMVPAFSTEGLSDQINKLFHPGHNWPSYNFQGTELSYFSLLKGRDVWVTGDLVSLYWFQLISILMTHRTCCLAKKHWKAWGKRTFECKSHWPVCMFWFCREHCNPKNTPARLSAVMVIAEESIRRIKSIKWQDWFIVSQFLKDGNWLSEEVLWKQPDPGTGRGGNSSAQWPHRVPGSLVISSQEKHQN